MPGEKTMHVCVFECFVSTLLYVHTCVFMFRTKALVLELLAAVCLVRGGHEMIIAAFNNFKEVRKDSSISLFSSSSLHLQCVSLVLVCTIQLCGEEKKLH